jgi:hypothetical protein
LTHPCHQPIPRRHQSLLFPSHPGPLTTSPPYKAQLLPTSLLVASSLHQTPLLQTALPLLLPASPNSKPNSRFHGLTTQTYHLRVSSFRTHPPSVLLLYHLPPPPTPTPTPTIPSTPTPTINPTPTTTPTPKQTIASSPSTARAYSGATDILLTARDASILTNYTPYTHNSRRPGFSIANLSTIYPIATGQLHIPNTSVSLTAYVFADTDLAENLFGIAPLINLGYTATYSRTGITIDNSHHHTIIYGTKHPNANVWQFSLPKPSPHSACIVVLRQEQDAELVIYASASFGSPAYQTFYHAVHMGWLTNYPGLTPKTLRRNKPHSPATALGHITASRSNVRSSRSQPTNPQPKLARSVQPVALFTENLDHYLSDELPDILLQCTVQHSSALRRDAVFSDLPGRFPVRAKDGTEYLLLSVYKNYVHVETLPDRSASCIRSAYSATHTFFRQLGHHVRVQILDNETSESLFTYFQTEKISYESESQE